MSNMVSMNKTFDNFRPVTVWGINWCRTVVFRKVDFVPDGDGGCGISSVGEDIVAVDGSVICNRACRVDCCGS